jgi:hypothetical protein
MALVLTDPPLNTATALSGIRCGGPGASGRLPGGVPNLDDGEYLIARSIMNDVARHTVPCRMKAGTLA